MRGRLYAAADARQGRRASAASAACAGGRRCFALACCSSALSRLTGRVGHAGQELSGLVGGPPEQRVPRFRGEAAHLHSGTQRRAKRGCAAQAGRKA